jgi:hypothetical protein
VENVGPITMHQQTAGIFMVVGVTAEMRASIDEADFFPPTASEPLRQNASSKSRSNDQKIKHHRFSREVESAVERADAPFRSRTFCT